MKQPNNNSNPRQRRIIKKGINLAVPLLLLPFALSSPLLFGVDNANTVSSPTSNTAGATSPPPTLAPSPPTDSQPVSAPSKLVQDLLGPSIIDILSQPDRVDSFQIFPELADDQLPSKNQLAGYPILKVGPLLTAPQIQTIQTLVLAETSYLFEVSNRCLFRPDTGLRFIKADQVVELLLSLSCGLWKFVYQDQGKTKDFNPAIRPQLQQLRTTLFP